MARLTHLFRDPPLTSGQPGVMPWRACTAQEAHDLWEAGFQVRRMRANEGPRETVPLGRVEVGVGEWPEMAMER